MQDLNELRPAPRRTPRAVLCLMAAVVVGGSGLLVWAPPTPAVDALASAAGPAIRMAAVPAPPLPASAAPAPVHPALGTLQVP
jgi:hypothetical protein